MFSTNMPNGRGLNHTRRSFLLGAGALAAGAASSSLLGCAPQNASSKGESQSGGTLSAENVSWDETFDVVVIGAGAAGLATACTVALEGQGATCLLAEKGQMRSGLSSVCLGTAIYTDNEEAMFQYMKEMAGEYQGTPDDVLMAYAHGAAENLEWIQNKLGANVEEMWIQPPGSPSDPVAAKPEYYEFEHSYAKGACRVGDNKEVEVKGASSVVVLMEQVMNEHSDVITYRTKAPMTALIQDPVSKAIVGAVIDGKNIKAEKGVIMAIGGFESNPEMMQCYFGQGLAVGRSGTDGNTGDGHIACQKIGAAFWHMNSCAGFWMTGRNLENTHFSHDMTWYCPKEYGITVAENGRRFYMDWDEFGTGLGGEQDTSGSAIAYQSDGTLNYGCRHGHMNFGATWRTLPMPPRAWFIFDQTGLTEGAIPSSSTTDPVADGFAYAADTIEELAQQIGVPADELAATVARWNECCENGEDVYFHRPEPTLRPLTQPPYYAQLCVSTFLNTDGGPVRSAKGEIIDLEGNPIPNLYSAGEFGSVWGDMYNGVGNIAECLIFGRISARSALGIGA